MKTFRILIFSLLLCSAGTVAQNGYGMNRDLRNTRTPKAPTPEEIEKERLAYIDKYMVKFREEVNLDALQEIAIRNEIITNSKNVDIVMKKEDSQDKAKEVKALMDKTDVVIMSYLSKAQKEKYQLFRANIKSKKKDKKEKKVKTEDEPTLQE
ncbi:hypothetical protein [Flavobacterium sp.]